VHLPMEFGSPICLSYVASSFGNPLYADSVTEEQQRLGFAHILVDVNLNSDFPREVELDMGAGERITIGIYYPWIPPKCKACNLFGHVAFACSKQEKKVQAQKRLVVVSKPKMEVYKQVAKEDGSPKGTFDKTIHRASRGNRSISPKESGRKECVNSFAALNKKADKES
jgi:hypothetical protein